MSNLDLTEAVDAAARVLYELRHPPDDECPHIPWEDTYQPGWRDDVLPLITAAAPFIAAQAAEAEREWWVRLALDERRIGRVMGAMDLAGAVPGVEFARRTQHKRCHEHCVEYLVCPTCSALTHVQTVSGRWDEVERHTARPFDPVAVTLFCGHVFGDMALARPGVAAREAE